MLLVPSQEYVGFTGGNDGERGDVGEADFRELMDVGKQVRRQMLENLKTATGRLQREVGKRKSHGNWKEEGITMEKGILMSSWKG